MPAITSLVRIEGRPPGFLSVTEFTASALIMPLSPQTSRQTHLFFRTDAVKKLQSRRCGLPAAPPVAKHSQIVFVIVIAV
jgi:hypothetical protein